MKKIVFSLLLLISIENGLIAQTGSVVSSFNSHNNHSPYFNNHILQIAYDSTACGLNYTQATSLITTRYNQYSQSTFGHGFPDTLTISALPTNYVVSKAYIYFIESYTTACPNPIVTFTDPIGIVHNAGAVLVGSDGPACWGETGTYGFRMDVTNDITTNGNYILDSLSCASVWEIDGASLIVVYRDLNANYEGTIDIYDGCRAIDGGSESTTITGFNICQTPSYGRGFVLSGDFQDNVGPHNIIVNNDTISFPSLFMNFDDTTANFVGGQTSSIMGASSPGDCYVIGVSGIYYRDTCVVCPSIISGEKELVQSNFSVNPNPTKGILSITSDKKFNKNIKVSLINILGEEIENQVWNPYVSGGALSLDIENYSNGVYFLILQSGEKKFYFKIIKE